jgi:hypothetical protein
MILMGMADQDGRGAASVAPRREQTCRSVGRIQWPAGIEDEPVALWMRDFDAASTDLPGAAMNR